MSYSITQPYGPTDYALEPPGQGYAHFHSGVDVSLPEGTALFTPTAGIVQFAGWDSTGYGNTVLIKYPSGYAERYAHLSAIAVAPGQQVSADTLIGAVGSTGNSSGPHLHFEVIDPSGRTVDPQAIDPGLHSIVTSPAQLAGFRDVFGWLREKGSSLVQGVQGIVGKGAIPINPFETSPTDLLTNPGGVIGNAFAGVFAGVFSGVFGALGHGIADGTIAIIHNIGAWLRSQAIPLAVAAVVLLVLFA